ncbi:RWD domain-containing protein 3 isoform X1 [Procambarus clarkii]|uniref:RWD domain-containing protein 3 isoform X1 n=1 Tax=Procambarus clarkii TaxID=6728 RepID=UPI001E671DA4|nr:RWD domain-containing protein 3-like isoform X1 [Procambarus clarkii]
MMDQIYEELEAIEAIFCRENEFSLHSKDISSVEFAVTTSPIASPDLEITVVFNLSANSYPNEPPSVSVQCSSLTRVECDSVKTFLKNIAESCCGAPMILNLLTALQENEDIRGTPRNTPTLENDTSKGPITCVLHLDHMRNKTRYLKTIKSWCEELDLFGRIIFCVHWIFIILQGNEENMKIYLQRNRTQCVDVDSSGKPCKERLLSVLYQGCHHKKFMDFEVCQVENIAELRSWMANCSSLDLFKDVIAPVISKR